MALSEITAATSPTVPRSAPVHSPASSGSAAAKREQLKRKAQRDGVSTNYYTNAYSAQKRAKRNARDEWVKTAGTGDIPPPAILRDFPKLHPRINWNKDRPAGQRADLWQTFKTE